MGLPYLKKIQVNLDTQVQFLKIYINLTLHFKQVIAFEWLFIINITESLS
jgi:hypothetical protein